LRRPETYSLAQIALHWTIAALVIYQLVLHEDIERAHRAFGRGGEPGLWNIHVVVGLAILALVTVRIILRFMRGTPPPPDNEPSIFRLLAVASHWTFYALLFIVPLSGILQWFLDVQRAGTIHELGKNLIILLLVIHIAAALSHQFVFRTNVLKRILGRA